MSVEAERPRLCCWARAMLLAIALASLIHPGPVVADGWVIKVAELEVEVLNTEVALAHFVAIAVELGGNWVVAPNGKMARIPMLPSPWPSLP